ncbi:cingulin-like protein 1 [Brachyhypopomus gauderio]|uniref:cingulin-like protein 1 n=1 Tax=Brachyhypopomus gauderio TaxID=698409 RepID=UPI0040412AA0
MELQGKIKRQDGHVHLDSNRPDQFHAPHDADEGSFGVKVQVQGIQGRPYVVLNGQGKSLQRPDYPDVFLMDQVQQEYVLTNISLFSSSSVVVVERDISLFSSSSVVVVLSTINGSLPSPLLNYHRHPELLQPYDPRSSSLDLQAFPEAKKKANSDLSPFNMTHPSLVCAPHVMVKRARIPLPGPGREGAQDQLGSGEPAAESVPYRQSHIICRLSVPDHSTGPRQPSQRTGRARHRTLMGPEERRRSRSVGESVSGDCSGTSPVPLAAQRLGEGAIAAQGSAYQNDHLHESQYDHLPRLTIEESVLRADIRTLTAAHFEQRQKKRMKSPRSGRVIYRTDRGNLSRSLQQNNDNSSPEREAQATPDILKGQRDILHRPGEDAAKLVLFNYLKDGSGEGEEIIKQKVNLLFEKIQTLRACTVQSAEELCVSVTEVKELQDRRASLEGQVSQLKQELEEELKKTESLSEASEKSAEEVRRLQEKLGRSEQEQVSLRQRLTDMEKELQASLEKLLQMKREREQSRAEARGLQKQLSDMHDELDSTKSSEQQERDAVLKELANLRLEFQELQQMQEEQEEILHWKERELTALKGALQDEISTHAKEVETLKEQHKEEVQRFLKAAEEAKEGMACMAQEKAEVEAEQGVSQAQVQELTLAKDLLLGRVRSLETQITSLNNIIQQAKGQESHLREHLDKLMEEKQRLEEEFSEVRQQEEDMCSANRALTRHLEDTQSELSRLNQEHRQLQQKLREEERHAEELQDSQQEMEQERRRQDGAFEKLQEEISAVLLGSERETQRLQEEVDKARDQSVTELNVLRTQLHSTQTELDKHKNAALECQKEICALEAELARREGELEQAEEKCKQLERRVEELQECSRSTQDDRDRQVKLMEARVHQLQEVLSDERSSGDLLMQRMERIQEQVGQVRAELLQERAARQELECDKMALERQNKDLSSQVSHLEGSQKSGQEGLVSRLELRIQELEERLMEEERDSSGLQQANRKLERKLKEMTMQGSDEQLALQNQRDQLILRLKSLKRQLDRAEEEIERLEHNKKKLQRELDEQQETNGQLQTQLSILRTDLRRKNKTVLKSLDEDEDEDEEDTMNSF